MEKDLNPTDYLQLSHLRHLIKAGVQLNSTLDFEELLFLTVRLTKELVRAEACSLLLLDGKELFYQVFSNQRVRKEEAISLMVGEGIAGWVAQEGKSELVNRPEKDPRFSSSRERKALSGTLFAPLRGRKEILGVLEAINRLDGKTFTSENLAFFSAFADQVGIAIENSRLYNQAKREIVEKSTLYEIGKTITSSLKLTEVLDLIVDSLRRVVDYDAAGIYLIDPVSQQIRRKTTRGYRPDMEEKVKLKVGEGVMGWVAKAGTGEIVPDVSQDPRYVMAKENTRSEIAAPLISEERVIGVFNLESEKLNAYDEEDLLLLTTFASQAAVAVENALLHEELTKKKLLEEDLALTRQIQRSFLPKFRPRIPGFDVSGINLPSQQVGGDYYDFIHITNGQLGLVVGDVSGKGFPASLIMASFRASLIAEIRNNYAISEILSKVNNLLYESTEEDKFVSTIYGVLDTEKKVFTYANAGHNAPILFRRRGEVEYLETGGIVLGWLYNSAYQEDRVKLNSGDILVMYTDGVTEAINKQREEFGVKRLLEVIRENSGSTARALRLKIVEEVRNFATSQADDLTLVVVITK